MRAQLELQDSLNASIDPEWRTKAIPWLRLVVLDGSKGLSLAADVDITEQKFCLVDIWCSVLSEAMLQYEAEAEAFLARYPDTNLGWGFDSYATRCYDIMDLSPAEHWELLIGFAALKAPLYQVVMLLRALMVDVGMSAEELQRYHKQLHNRHALKDRIRAYCQIPAKA